MGAKALLTRNIAKKLVSKMRRATSSLSAARKPPGWAMPALLTTSVTSVASAAAAATSFGLLTLSRPAMEPHGLDAGLRDERRVARADVDLAGAAGEQRARECQPDAAIGARDEGNS